MAPERTFLRPIVGPKGKAEIFEVLQGSNNDATVVGEVVDYEVVFNNIVDHLDASTRFDHFIYRESELDGVCRLVEMAIKETPNTDLHAMQRLEAVLGAARDAHDPVADEKPDEAARRLRQVL